MTTENSFYVKILLWAYDKTSEGIGFTEEEIINHFDLKNGTGEKYRLYLKLFKNGTDDNHPVIVNYNTDKVKDKEVGFWCLSNKGMASAINYLDLKEARDSSSSAKMIAFWSIGIAVVVGFVQIFVAFFQVYLDYFKSCA